MEKLESLVPVVVAQSKKLFKTKGRHISVATAKEDSQTDVLTKLQHVETVLTNVCFEGLYLKNFRFS